MIKLPNGCTCSKVSVHPKNWHLKGATISKDWYLQYYFYDPSSDDYPAGRLFIVKGMNCYKTLESRRAMTKIILDAEIERLEVRGYNPNTRKYYIPVETNLASKYEIPPTIPVLQAFRMAMEKLKAGRDYKKDVKSALTYIDKSVISLGYDLMQIQDVRRKHIQIILDNCKTIKDYWSAHLFNHYRTYLMSLYKVLLKYSDLDSNPVEAIPKDDDSREGKMREVLTDQERLAIDQHFAEHDPYFRRFLNIFFHSGAREIELLKVTAADVDLEKQVYYVTVKKGGKTRTEDRPIKNNAMPFWKELMDEVAAGSLYFTRRMLENNKPEDLADGVNWKNIYIFGKYCRPSFIRTTRSYVTHYWQDEVKIELKINKDLYSLKALNLDETAAELSALDASKQAGHSTPVVTIKHYLVGEKKRTDDRLRGVGNKFAG